MKSTPVRTVASIWAWFALAMSVVIIVPTVLVVRLVTAPFDPGRYWAGRTFRMIGVITDKLNPLWKFSVSGKIPDDPRRPYVVVANHESFVDILLLCELPFEMKWMSKSDFFKYPLVGWAMRAVGDIRLERGDRKSGIRALQEARDRIAKKVSVMIFPEGTRSADGNLQEFKEGAFRLAIDTGVPILPVAIVGTRSALVKHDWRFGVAHAEARVLEPIPTDGLDKGDVIALRDQARDAISAALDEMRKQDASRS